LVGAKNERVVSEGEFPLGKDFAIRTRNSLLEHDGLLEFTEVHQNKMVAASSEGKDREVTGGDDRL
jgi:hypothetical protein